MQLVSSLFFTFSIPKRNITKASHYLSSSYFTDKYNHTRLGSIKYTSDFHKLTSNNEDNKLRYFDYGLKSHNIKIEKR